MLNLISYTADFVTKIYTKFFNFDMKFGEQWGDNFVQIQVLYKTVVLKWGFTREERKYIIN